MKTIKKNGAIVYPITVPTPYDVGDVNLFLFEEKGELSLIDAGIDSEQCWEALVQTLAVHGFTLHDLSRILITHNHVDHIGLINQIAMHQDILVYAHPEAIPRMKRDRDFLTMRIQFFDQLYREMGCGEGGARQVQKLQEAVIANERFKIEPEIIPIIEADRIGSFQVVEVFGHAPDHLAFWDADRSWLFAGDHLIHHISSNAFVEPDREGRRIRTVVAYVQSLKKCLALDAEIVFAGHGEWIGNHKELIEKRLARIEVKAEKIRALIHSGIETAYELAQNYYPTKYSQAFSPVMSEIIGLLDYLEAENRIHKRKSNGIWRYYCVE
ncbi:MBL fold metallo-hydrolase [Brevibacillus porteri]|uniref:MBL fold metallo-hydrolase n=1 Tax=Brevibacillus porteri TaxID=2126350 RepID=UPI0036333340